MQSVLDVIIDPTKAQAGARAVNQALSGMGGQAGRAMDHLRYRVDTVKNSLFSMRSAIAALGIASFARSLTTVSHNLDLAARGMRAVTTSAGQAAIQLERVRAIEDEFQTGDLPMARAYRLLASNGLPDVEQSLRTVANAAVTLGEDIETVINGILAGEERSLRRLGIQMIDLGQGEVDLVLGDMEVRAQKTDDALRKGLLQLLEKGFPNATEQLASSMEHQFKRVMDAWDDVEVAIMRGGLEDFLTATFRTFSDAWDVEEANRKGKQFADGVREVMKTVSRDVAVVIDLTAPLGRVIFGTVEKAWAGFQKLPPEIQTIGLFGALWFGKRGLLILTAGLAITEKLGLSFDDAMKQAAGMVEATQKIFGSSPGEIAGNILLPPGLRPRDQQPPESQEDRAKRTQERAEAAKEALGLGTGRSAAKVGSLFGLIEGADTETKTALETLNKFWASVDQKEGEIRKKRAADLAQAEAERKAGKSGLIGQGVGAGERILTAQMEKLKRDTDLFVKLEEDKPRFDFDPDMAAAMQKSLDYTTALQERSYLALDRSKVITEQLVRAWQEGVEPTDRIAKNIHEQFLRQGEATKATRVWSELISKVEIDLDEAVKTTKLMEIPIEERELEADKIRLSRTLLEGNLKLSDKQLESLLKKLGLLDQERSKLAAAQNLEQERLSIQEETARLLAEARDMQGGTQAAPIGSFRGAVGTDLPSKQTILDQKDRQAKARGLAFDRAAISEDIDAQLAARKINFLTRTNYELDIQIASTKILTREVGQHLDAREAEIRTLQLVQQLQQRGVQLDQNEIESIRKKSQALQDAQASLRTSDAINSMVDNWRVGWDTIVRAGDQAFSHLEDAMTQWIMTGKMDFDQFANYVTQELVRMGVRASMSLMMNKALSAMGNGSGSGGFNLGDLISMGISSMSSGTGGTGTMTGTVTSGLTGLGTGSSGPVTSSIGMKPLGLQQGGVFEYSKARGFHAYRSYYDIPGAQQGMVSTHERLLRISEGHTAEAVIPLKGGKVPVEMKSGGKISINAPITIITPDAGGVRRSEAQIQAQLSSALARSARRVG